MALQFLNNIDLNKFQIYNLRLHTLAAAPASPVAGLVYYDSNLSNFYGYNGSSWLQLSGGGAGVSSVGLSAPSLFTVSGSPVTSTGNLSFAWNGSSSNLVRADGSTIAQSSLQASHANLTSLSNLANPGSTAKLQITSGGVMSWDTTVYLTSINTMTGPGITIAGTANQISIANATNTVTLSLPQDIATTSSPTFAKVTLSNAPTVGSDAVTKTYVDNLLNGLRDYKESVRVATTGNITLSGTQTIDGIGVVAGDRVLVLNQSTSSQNGIYVVAAGAWSRSTDFASGVNTGVTLGVYVYVSVGTTNGQSGFVLSASNATAPETSINVGTDTITFTKFSGATLYSFSTGLRTNSTTISVGNFALNGLLVGAGAGADATVLAAGSQYSVLVAGASGVPTWGTINLASAVAVGSSVLAIANGGTGASSASGARSALGAPGKYTTTITGDGSTTAFTVTHNLGSQNVTWSVADNSATRLAQFIEVSMPSGGNTLILTFGVAPTNGTIYNVTVIG